MESSPAGINAIPSGHFAWALLAFWFARRYCSPGVGRAFAIYAALTALATLGTGEHWMIDLVLSVPFAAGIWVVVHQDWLFSGAALAAVLTWLAALREGWTLALPPLPAWLLAGFTISFFALTVMDPDSEGPAAALFCS